MGVDILVQGNNLFASVSSGFLVSPILHHLINTSPVQNVYRFPIARHLLARLRIDKFNLKKQILSYLSYVYQKLTTGTTNFIYNFSVVSRVSAPTAALISFRHNNVKSFLVQCEIIF